MNALYGFKYIHLYMYIYNPTKKEDIHQGASALSNPHAEIGRAASKDAEGDCSQRTNFWLEGYRSDFYCS